MMQMINVHRENSQRLFEANYKKLVSLLPDMVLFEHISLSSENHNIAIAVDVLERTPYTTLLRGKCTPSSN